MDGAFSDCSEIVAVANESDNKKGNKRKRKGDKGNKEEVKNSPLYGISTTAGRMTRSVHLGSQYDRP